jgi:transposase
MIDRLQREVQELRVRLQQNSSNSSKPPSSDGPTVPPQRTKPTGRKRGGQPGHKKHERALVPVDEVTTIEVVRPSECRRCGGSLSGDDPEPYRHQVIEIPEVKPLVSEYVLHALRCDHCRVTTAAPLPDQVPAGQFGPRLQAMVAVCSGAYRMSKRSIEELLNDFFKVDISLGSIANLERATSEAIAAPVEEVAAAVKQSPVVHADETGWYQRSQRAWLWVATTARLAVFLIRQGRGKKVAMELLGERFSGTAVTDRFTSYLWLPQAQRQVCWAHLARDFAGFKDYGDADRDLGEALEHVADRVFRLWHDARDGTISRRQLRRRIGSLRLRLRDLLVRGTGATFPQVRAKCREILAIEPAMWTFAYRDGVEPTNNAAERAVRHGVLWRRTSFGTDSANGSRFVERILTVVTTLRLQKRNVLDYLARVCAASLRGQPAPSLLAA